jgi:hypothetical protein
MTRCLTGLALCLLGATLRAQTSAPVDATAATATLPPVTTEERRQRLLLLDLEALAVEPATARIIDGLLTDAVHRHSEQLELLTAADMRQMLELEATKQGLGCTTESCLAELAGAMGARYVVFGQVGKLDTLTLVQLNLFDSRAARSLGRKEIRTQNLATLADAMQPAVDELLAPLLATAAQPTAAAADEGAAISPLLWVGSGVAAVGALAALGLGGTSLWMNGELGRPAAEVTPTTKEGYLQAGPWLLAGAGAAVVLALAGVGVAAFGLVE